VWVSNFQKKLKKSGGKLLCKQLSDAWSYSSNAPGCADVMNEAGRSSPSQRFISRKVKFYISINSEILVVYPI